MDNQFYYSVKQSVKNWWVSLLIGIIALIVGIWSLVTPDVTLVALTYVFVFAFFASGIFEIIFAVSNKDILNGWGWTLAGGIIDIVFGILLLLLPLPIITMMLIYFVGFWIIFRSIWMIGESFDLKHIGIRDWGWFLALGIIGILFAIIFILSPIFSGAFIVAFISIAFLVYGVFRIYLAVRLKSVHNSIQEIEGK